MQTYPVLPAILMLVSFGVRQASAEIVEVPVKNPSFERGLTKDGAPVGWLVYGGLGKKTRFALVDDADEGKKALLIDDGDPEKPFGIYQKVVAQEGLTYETSVRVRGVPGASSRDVNLQMRFLPSNKLHQTSMQASREDEFDRVSVRGTAPKGTKLTAIYLYTRPHAVPKIIVDRVKIVSGMEPPEPPLPQPPKPVPPIYKNLKKLFLETDLVKNEKPSATIIAPKRYAALGLRIQASIEKQTGVKVPVLGDDSVQAAVPIRGNLIALGNRSTNKIIEELYNRYYTLLDLRYPGPGGHVVRTLHNPFGSGHNVVFIGGSDDEGVLAATDVFTGIVDRVGRSWPGTAATLKLGRIARIKLGKGIVVPKNVREMQLWEASKGYRSSGTFGWNIISKQMAAYYMTGDEFHAREFLRLAFPDKKARKEIAAIDNGRVRDKKAPLTWPHHYNAYMLILYWDLIEESPVFSNELRLRITNAFSKQLEQRINNIGGGIYKTTRPPARVGTRHGQWGAISLYCLGRYFQKDYPNPIWRHCEESAKRHFWSLHDYAWVGGESDNLFWYSTGIAPIFAYLALTGDRKPVENGVAQTLLRGLDILASGRPSDWALDFASIGFLHRAAYLCQDSRYLDHRRATGVDTSVFRLGQSFWPDEHLASKAPDALAGRWHIRQLSKPAWLARRNGFKLGESFEFGSFRNTEDASGDFVLIDGLNGASRNPYHCFAILHLRIGGNTILDGYHNQVLTRADGLVEPKIAMNAALKHRDVIGPAAMATAEVPDAAYCNWRRSLVQRAGQYALIVDDLTFRSDSENVEIQFLWEAGKTAGLSNRAPGLVQLSNQNESKLPAGWLRFRALDTQCATNLDRDVSVVKLDKLGITLLRSKAVGDWLEMPFRTEKQISGEVFVDLLDYRGRGAVRMSLDRKPAGKPYNHYAPNVSPGRVSLGKHKLAQGEHRLRVTTTAMSPEMDQCYIGLTGVTIRTDQADSGTGEKAFSICLSDSARTAINRNVIKIEWRGAVKKEQRLIFFSTISKSPIAVASESDHSFPCARVADNAAALTLPEPALGVAGEFQGIAGELVVLAQSHLFARGLRQARLAGYLVGSSTPMDVDWDFDTGRLHLVAAQDATLNLATNSDHALVDGERTGLEQEEEGIRVLTLKAGRHVIENLKPRSAELQKIRMRLKALLLEGRAIRAKKPETPQVPAELPVLQSRFSLKVGTKVTDLITIPSEVGPLICAVANKTVHLLSADGAQVKQFQADGAIRMLRWWDEHRLLLAGCADEKVIAFDLSGRRKWVFTSVMDPALYSAGNLAWVKSTRGNQGIHGLHTGVFLDGKSQAFVGSASTLEILDEDGNLIRRMPQHWGLVSTFALVDNPDGTRNLLAARRKNGVNSVAIINSKTLNPRPRGFLRPPPGHDYVPGWASMNRHHLFYEDLDGDGVKEVISEINGTWNRVMVWSASGKALFDASFGPGRRIQARNMRDLDIADLDNDGRKEILTATSSGLVVVLDSQCRKVWSKRLPIPPTVMKVMKLKTPPWIVVGCADGTVFVLDRRGAIIRWGAVKGTPTAITALDESEHEKGVLIGTSKGEVILFSLSVN